MSYKIDRKDSFYLGSVVIGLIGLGAATLAVAALVLPRFQALRYPAIFDKKFFVQTMISMGTVGAALSFACLLAGHRTKSEAKSPPKPKEEEEEVKPLTESKEEEEVKPITNKEFKSFKKQPKSTKQPPQTEVILGQGNYGTVYATNTGTVYKTMQGKDSASQSDRAVQSCSESDREVLKHGISAQKPDLELEFFIGNKLEHPLFAKSLELFEHGFTMEKAEGEMPQNFDKTAYIKICEQLKEACLHLFDKGIYWADLSPANILWKRDDNTIKLIDFGAWRIEEDDAKRAQYLLFNAYIILSNLSQLFAPDKIHWSKLFYKLDGCDEYIDKLTDPMSIRQLQDLFNEKTTTEEMRAILAQYFDAVIAQINSYEGPGKHEDANANSGEHLNDDDIMAYMQQFCS